MKGLLPIVLVYFILSAAGEAYGTCWALWGFDTFRLEWPLDRPFAGHVRRLPNAGAGALAWPGDQTARRTRAVLVGIACACIALVAMAFANQGWIVFAIMPIFALAGVGTPAFQALATRQVDPARQGQLQGVLASAVSLASIVAPAGLLDLLLCRSKEVARSHLALGGRHLRNRGPAGFSRRPACAEARPLSTLRDADGVAGQHR